MKQMNISYLTIFPEIYSSFLETSLIKKCSEKNLVSFKTIQLRDYAEPPHFKVDDTPYGGGPGMLMTPEPIAKAITAFKSSTPNGYVIALSARGARFTQETAKNLSTKDSLLFVCGRYEGIDQRVLDEYCDIELSLGQFVTMGGEVPSMAMTEAIVRLLPGVIGNQESYQTDSFASSLEEIEAPQYTRPEVFNGVSVPHVLLSGNHQEIKKWRNGGYKK